MKKYVIAILLLVMFFLNGICQAAVHSTQENFNIALKQCISALNDTEDYYEVMKRGDDAVIYLRQKDCELLEESLGHFKADGAESLTLLLETKLILQGRGLSLEYYLSAMDAYRAGRIALYEEYRRRLEKSFKEAEIDRKKFRAKYGY